MRALVACAALLSGCFSPTIGNGELQCASGPTPCPSGFHCAVDQTCWKHGQDPIVDGGGGDLPPGAPRLIQYGALCQAAGSCMLKLTLASSPGTLLVATFESSASPTPPPLPAPWLLASGASYMGRSAAIWYYPNNPGGITSVTAGPGLGAARGQLTEWDGLSALDLMGNATAQSGSTLTVSTSSAPTGTVAITAFAEVLSAMSSIALTASSGWTLLASDDGAPTDFHVGSYFRLLPAGGGAPSEMLTSTMPGVWVGAIATFK